MNTRDEGLFDGMDLPGFDIRSGLATSLNKEALYRRMLVKFRDGQGDFAHLFAAARGEPDPSAAERCAHTLRGTAATVGARQVQEWAERLEQACRQRAPAAEIDDLLRQVLEALSPVVVALQALGDENAGAPLPLPAAVDSVALAAQRARLIELLNRGDALAIDLCDTQADLFRAAYPAQWKEISDCVHGFDFEAALERIVRIT